MNQDELLQDVALKLDLANMELQTIDEVLARRPAFAGLKHRTEKIEHACRMNGELLTALKASHQEMVGLRAYLQTCETGVMIDNLPTLIASLGRKCEQAETAIRKAERQ